MVLWTFPKREDTLRYPLQSFRSIAEMASSQDIEEDATERSSSTVDELHPAPEPRPGAYDSRTVVRPSLRRVPVRVPLCAGKHAGAASTVSEHQQELQQT
jgi:hypothetical protein